MEKYLEVLAEGAYYYIFFQVSHRLSLVKNMDRIYFIKNGEIVEEGNHTELMELGGEYAKMFILQAERYGI